MTNPDPFQQPPCGCPDLPALIDAELSGKERPLCETHDADLIASRKVDAERDEIRARQGRTEDVIAGVIDEWNTDERAKAAARREQAIDGLADPLLGSLIRATGADLPVGLDPSAYPGTAGFREMDAHEVRRFNTDQLAQLIEQPAAATRLAPVRDLFDFSQNYQPTTNPLSNPNHPGFVPDDAA